jgi:uncharacterized protein YkwD
MRLRGFVLSIACSLFVVSAISNSLHVHSQTKTASGVKAPPKNGLSKEEADLFNEINQVRAHPELYVAYLQKMKPLFVGKIYRKTLETREGWAAVEEAIAYLQTVKPQVPFTMSAGLSRAAAAHIKDQSSTGSTGHKTTGSGWLIEDRVKPFGNWEGAIGENLTYGRESARERILTWLIDDGFATRGHRKRVMSGDYGAAGLSCGKHPEYERMCCLTLAGAFVDTVPAARAPAAAKKSGTPLPSAAPTPRKF